MKPFLIYILQSGLCLAVFYSVYELFLKRETYFQLNRIFLVSGLLLSFLIPAFPITSPFKTRGRAHKLRLCFDSVRVRARFQVRPIFSTSSMESASLFFSCGSAFNWRSFAALSELMGSVDYAGRKSSP